MGYIVDVRTGAVVESGDIGNLAELLNAMSECEIDVSHLRLFVEDDLYGEVA